MNELDVGFTGWAQEVICRMEAYAPAAYPVMLISVLEDVVDVVDGAVVVGAAKAMLEDVVDVVDGGAVVVAAKAVLEEADEADAETLVTVTGTSAGVPGTSVEKQLFGRHS